MELIMRIIDKLQAAIELAQGYRKEIVDFESLKDKTVLEVYSTEDVIEILTDDGLYYLEHIQDCCEQVYVESIVGDLQSLVGQTILLAEESTNSEGEPSNEWQDSFTWTFYKLATIKGYVDIRWYGTSNGYYSESVTCRKLTVGR